MSITFTKLFSSITESTVWCEDANTRIVWIAMLAMADRQGRVWASIPGLANRARVPVDACREAIDKFLGPDPDSRTKDHDGRRIAEIDGGWVLLNHEKYRSLRSEEERREYKREWTKNSRRAKSQQCGQDVDKSGQSGPQWTHAEADTEADTDKDKDPSDPCQVDDLTTAKPDPHKEDIQRVFDHWRIEWTHPNAKLDKKRSARIRARLREKFTADQLCQAISGFKNSPWHTGDDPKGQGVVYDSIETLLRDRSQVEKGIELLTKPPKPASPISRHQTLSDVPPELRNANR